LNVHTGTFSDAPYELGSFDVVSIRHVLEHVPDPLRLVAEARAFLRPHGLLLIAVPNFGSLAARLLGTEWWWIDPPTHLFYFTRVTITRLLAKHGFRSIAYRTERGDDETLGFYLLFALNQRLGLGRRLRTTTQSGNGTVDGGSASSSHARETHQVWSAVQRIGEGIEAAAWPLVSLADRAGLGAELLVISRKLGEPATPPVGLIAEQHGQN
jgi:SAM-dependent methyltransferase